MESLIYNVSAAKVRRETAKGRSFLVAPVRMIVEGVLNGSQGKLFYPRDEMFRNVEAWNGTPAVVYHPVDEKTGQAVSARSPHVMGKSEIGRVYNAKGAGRELDSEVWFDEEDTRRVDPSIIDRLVKGDPIEVSTGLYTDNHPAPKGSNYNGVEYDFIARNYRPDHLAILPDQKGACSLDHGCGVLINEGKQPSGVLPEKLEAFRELVKNWDEGKHPRAADGKFGTGGGSPTPKGADGKGGDSKPAPASSPQTQKTASRRTLQIMKKIASAGYDVSKVGAKVVAAGAKVLGKGLKEAYDRYGNVGAMGTFATTHLIVGAATGIAVGGAAPVAAVAFGLAAMELRHQIKKFTSKVDDSQNNMRRPATNADEPPKGIDLTDLAKHILGVVAEFSHETGTKVPLPDIQKVKNILITKCGMSDKVTTTNGTDMTCNLVDGVCINCGGKGGKPGPCDKGGFATGRGTNPYSSTHYRNAIRQAGNMTARADAMSSKAVTAKQHAKAAKAHDKALMGHNDAAGFLEAKGDKEGAAEHRKKAAEHEAKMKNHQKSAGTTMNRERIIDHLVTNNPAWGYDEDRAILSTFSDEKLARLRGSSRPTYNAGSMAKEAWEASDSAYDATAKAKDSKSVDDHMDAAKAHVDASKKHKDAARKTDGGESEMCRAMSKAHSDSANDHMAAAQQSNLQTNSAMTANCGGCATANAMCDKCKAQMADQDDDEDSNGDEPENDEDGDPKTKPKRGRTTTTANAVVTNSNPQGYNQYTSKGGAALKERGEIATRLSAEADKASKAAKNSSSGHAKASAAHQVAAAAHRSASMEATSAKTAGSNPDYGAGKYHDKMARKHEKKATVHTIKSNTATRNSTTVTTEGTKKMTTEEYLKATNAPPEVVAAVNNSVRIVNERKSRIVDQLVANVSDDAKRKTHIDILMKKDLVDLEMELERMPAKQDQTNNGDWSNGYVPAPTGNYAGAAGSVYANNSSSSYGKTDDDVLMPVTINWGDGFDASKVA